MEKFNLVHNLKRSIGSKAETALWKEMVEKFHGIWEAKQKNIMQGVRGVKQTPRPDLQDPLRYTERRVFLILWATHADVTIHLNC